MTRVTRCKWRTLASDVISLRHCDWRSGQCAPPSWSVDWTASLHVDTQRLVSPPANILSGSSDSEHRRLLSWWSCRRSRCYDGRLGLVADTRPDGRTDGRSETEVLREGSYDQRRARPPNDNLRCCRRCCKMAHILFRRLRLRLQARES